MPIPAVLLAAAPLILPKLLEYAPVLARHALGLLPARAGAVVTKVINTVHRTATAAKPVVDALATVSAAVSKGGDITQAELEGAVAAMDAAVDAFAAQADEIRRQEAAQHAQGT